LLLTIGTGRLPATPSDPPPLTATAFLTFSVTAGATPTPQGCPDTPDPGGDKGGAMLILVNASQRHGICSRGDEDWFKFGAVGNKVYTIDIPQMDNGLDLSLELYDSDGNPLTRNDDSSLQTPPAPAPKDNKPKTPPWRAPKDGTYYTRARDNLNSGGGTPPYTIIVQTESYAPTPA